MVIATDTPIPPVYDVVFVVEKTANLAAYLDALKTSYIIPTLEYFNGGPPDSTDYGNDFSCTLYSLVTFHAGDISPSPAASCEYPTTSTHKFLSYLDETEFIGGEAQSFSHISEGLSTALQVFDEIKRTRNHSIPSERHCVLVCNSPPYHLPSQESEDYSGFTSEQLASMLGQRGIYLTIISPRKIPALQRLYEESCSSEVPFTPSKDYTVDPRHMVLLHGFQLQERSHSPSLEDEKQTSDLIKSSIVSGSGNTSGTRVSSPAPPASTEGQFKVPQPTGVLPNITQQPSPQPHVLSPLNPQNVGPPVQQQNVQQPPPQQQQQQPSPQQQQAQQQQQQQSQASHAGSIQQPQSQGQMGMGPPMQMRQATPANTQTKMAISTAMSTANQQSQNPMVTMAITPGGQQVRPLFQKNGQIITIASTQAMQGVKQEQGQKFINPRGQTQPQQAGMVGQPRPAVTMVTSQNPMTSQPGMMASQPGMIQQNVMTTQQQQQQKIRVGMQNQTTTSQQVSMGDNSQNVSQQGMSMPNQQQQHIMQQGPPSGQMVMQGLGSAPQVGGQGFPGSDAGVTDPARAAQAQAQGKKIIWKGSLEYQEKPKPQGPPNQVQQKNTKTLNCCISISNTEPDLNARNWPEKLVMQLLPQPMLHELQSLFRNSRQVSFHFSPNDLDALRNLYRIMGNGFAGCVHFAQTPNCDIRVLLLLYSSKKKAFVGLIPNDQGAFVQGIRNVLNKVRGKQQTQTGNQPMTTTLPMQTPPQIQNPGGIQNNPNMGQIGMQQMPITTTQQAMPIQQQQQQDPMQQGNNCIMISGPQDSSSSEPMMARQQGMDMITGQQDRASLQQRIQMLENNLQAAKQKELQYQQQEQAKKAAMVVRQQQNLMLARQQQQLQLQQQQQQQQQQQRLQMQQAVSQQQQQQQQQQQLHHILLNQQNPQAQQTPQQQQLRQQIILQQQQQNMRGAAPQTQQSVMGAPSGQQQMQAQLAMQQPGQNYGLVEEFGLPDII